VIVIAPSITELQRDEPSGLDWEAFSAAYSRGSRRHDLHAIVAYGAYRRSLVTGERQARRTDAMPVEEWEGEGGASL
jgi:hypothetical protein